MSSVVAERLYYDDRVPEWAGEAADALEFRAVVADIRLVSRGRLEPGAKSPAGAKPATGRSAAEAQLWQVALDRTAFFPEGGGQPCDTGVLIAQARSGAVLEVVVERVEEDQAGEVWHYIRKPLVEGTVVAGRLDAERRIDHAQQHSGQHLLSAVFLRELGARTVSFHLPPHRGSDGHPEPVTIDLAGVERLSEDDLTRVEAAANRLVYEDRELRSRWVSRAEAEAMLQRGDLRKLPDFLDYRAGGPVRIVEILGVEFNACGGTHVRSTGAIGGLTVRRVEKVKQGWRVEFCCGLRAVRLAGADFARLSAAAATLSSGVSDVPGRVAALLEDARSAAKQRKALFEDLARAEAVLLAAGVDPGAVVIAIFAGKDLEFVKRVAARVADLGRAAVIGATTAAGASNGLGGAVAVARSAGSAVHCGDLLRELLSRVGGRGGGAAELAQGICPTDQVEDLMAQLTQELSG